MKKSKILFSIAAIMITFMFSSMSVYAASGDAYIHWYKEPGFIDRTPTYTNSYSNLGHMGYVVYGYDNAGAGSALSQLQSGAIFVVHNHGDPGIQYMGSDGSGIVASPNAAGNGKVYLDSSIYPFANLKIAILYGCKTGLVTGISGDISQLMVNKGATAAVSWTVDTHIPAVNEWNRLFFEKARTGSSIVESFRHADYWTTAILGSVEGNRMQNNRNEKGNIYATLN